MNLSTVIATAVAVGVCLLFGWVLSLRRSVHHTFVSAVRHLMMLMLLKIFGFFSYRSIMKTSQNAIAVNEQTLLEILKKNKDTEYGKLYKFGQIKTKKQWKEQHPLTRYDHYKPFISKILDGAENVLTAFSLRQIGTTSGTSGAVKLIPMTMRQLWIMFYGVCLTYYTILKYFPSAFSLQKSLKIMFEPEFRRTASGLMIGPTSSRPSSEGSVLSLYSSPVEIYTLTKEYMDSSKFLHVMWALLDKNLGAMEANFAGSIYNDIFLTIENNWETLVRSIKEGTIPESIALPSDTRKKLSAMLKPNPQRAAELEREFYKGTIGIIRRIWPYFNYIVTTDTGSHEIYGRSLKKYTSGNPDLPDVKIYSPFYGATEGFIGTNLDPNVKTYVFLPTSLYIEFIPVEYADDECPVILDLEHIEVGQLYELVITTFGGLYRYRFGDVVRVHSFLNRTPVFEFQYRQGQNNDLHGEKTSEYAIFRSISRAVSSWQPTTTLIDYTTIHHIDLQDDVPRYHVYVELSGQERVVTEREKDEFDRILSEENAGYKYHRDRNNIHRADLVTVKRNTFNELVALMVASTANVNQVKMPRVLKNKEHVQLVVDHVVRKDISDD